MLPAAEVRADNAAGIRPRTARDGPPRTLKSAVLLERRCEAGGQHDLAPGGVGFDIAEIWPVAFRNTAQALFYA